MFELRRQFEMYTPRFDVVLRSLNLTLGQYREASSLTIPAKLLRFLLQRVLLETDFDEKSYLSENPDISDAVNRGLIDNPKLHYLGNGYFEGRLGGTPRVDEEWYLRTYPDVAAAVRAGSVASGSDHFNKVGAAEFRAPGPTYEEDAVEWGKAFGKTPLPDARTRTVGR
jgi:hypothetical protein